jgi:hypothetical protein
MKKEYIIVGSDNFWYSSDLASIKEVKEEIENIKKDITFYADNESGENRSDLPKALYIYKAELIKKIDLR